MTTTLPPTYFDDLYERAPDPWAFETSPYEDAKYAATLAALPHARYGRVLEVGCSIGVLTKRLASRCDHLVAIDPAARALDTARARCLDLPSVSFVQGHVPADWPSGSFDLIVLSEVIYYLGAPDVDALAARVDRSLRPGGQVLLVHWVRETDYPLSGDAASDQFIRALGSGYRRLARQRTDDYRLDLLAAG
ncbi:class I SAM-dependent methyltransferase [Methylobrevis pamukkalensis]|uniref:Chondramide synthase cmdD n=1 Tax=Methylobrevis pamukkalensis TaxID=1439726 RepID=A0A1E3H6F6_9HYPH|nr:class I SAM-dependent methyltransferase [Methylobrevis pamukkalensis]ODN71894.1 Chondramide synthase cmdD [Methylobrevis pamukkalensis]